MRFRARTFTTRPDVAPNQLVIEVFIESSGSETQLLTASSDSRNWRLPSRHIPPYHDRRDRWARFGRCFYLHA